MRAKLLFASTLTLGILFSFVFFVFFLIAYYTGKIEGSTLILATIGFSFVSWWVSPFLTDGMLRWLYKAQLVDFEKFSLEHPPVAAFINETSRRAGIRVPQLFIIDDRNPTAFCYGSTANRARIVASRGLFEYLDAEEQKAVYGHELGHIVNRDFIVMTVAATLLQVLYEVYVIFYKNRRGRSGKKDPTPMIGLLSYVFWLIGSYLILYLSRTREYLADRFSAQATGNPNALSLALVKIAYGIAAEPDADNSRRLLVSTRSMGIYDFKAADSVGGAFGIFKNEQSSQGTGKGRDLSRIFWFDIFSPWAKLGEFSSTHPLTGKRVEALSDIAREMSQEPRFDFAAIKRSGQTVIDRSRLYAGFFQGIFFYFLPHLSLVGSLVFLYHNRSMVPLVPVILGLGFLIQGVYKFSAPTANPETTTVFDLMCDPYASPLNGRFVEIEGEVIGKAQAGSVLGEDVTMQDKSGGLIYLNYESAIPLFGNIFFGFRRANPLIGQLGIARGWFRRSTYQIIDLHTLNIGGQLIASYTRFWGMFMGFLLMASGVVWSVFVIASKGN